ncbi:MAG: transcriptional regulator [Armatimonadetes bacterium]|nr:transcriptional regulator [Armatimonadota bacterium]
MSQVISMRLRDEQVERLQRLARRLGRTPSETGAMLVEESLRQAEFGQIEFRPSAVGRQAYLRGSTLAVWEVLQVARAFQLDADRTAAHLDWPRYRVQAALNYAAAFPDEIDLAIADCEATGWQALSRQLPQAELFEIANDPDV